MFASRRRRAAAVALGTAAILITAAPVGAVSPTVVSWTGHVERPFVDCPGFTTIGRWTISHRLTIFSDTDGVAIRDIEAVDYAGEIVNPATGASVADSGSRTFFDTLAPDGSFLTTYAVEVRKSRYVHTAGRTDFQTGDFAGTSGFDDAGVAALCDALDG
jgi:hypothetical protein